MYEHRSLNTDLSKVINTTKRHLKKLEYLGLNTVQDLLLYFPRTHEDQSKFVPIAEMRTDQSNTIKGTLSNFFTKMTRNKKFLTKALITDDSGSVEVVWFNQPFIKQALKAGDEVILSGKIKFAMGKISMQSPSYEKVQQEQLHTGRIVPVYHETDGLTSKWIRQKIRPLMQEWTKRFYEYLPEKIRKEEGLIDYTTAITNIHFPDSEELLEKSKQRLSFDELFLLQFQALHKKWLWQKTAAETKKEIPKNEKVLNEFLSTLPFELTGAQKRSLDEILTDLDKPYPMSRLLQGDVGSGKTIVATAAVLMAAKAGYQTTIMAPTEILARQHYTNIFKFLQPYGFNIQFIAGSTKKKQKEEIIQQMKSGTADVVIGTHALIQETIGFKNLGLAIIDEQHRFGVKQREILKSFGNPHLLALSATPIPRTLAMTIYGDQDLSIIDEMPAGRKEIVTRIVPEAKRIDAYRWIEDSVKKGRQVYVICPLVDESDTLEVKSVLQEFETLKLDIFPNLTVDFLHGKMPNVEKDLIMGKFKAGESDILVSTSVIEVGIDVPNASIILIEGSERFGLSQLHQFRGRVGRGEHQSYCFLFTNSWSEQNRTRLNAMVNHSSGFKLAEIDLELRGPGEIYGIRQSGIPDLKMASLTDSITIAKARKAAEWLINEDPTLENHFMLKKKIDSLKNEVMVGETKVKPE